MYPIDAYHFIEKFTEHNSSKNDIQILYDGKPGSKELGHALCLFYQASSQQVLIYDSMVTEKLDLTHKKIIRKLYPFNKGIVFQQPKFVQGKTITCKIFAIIYATMLLLGKDPDKNDFKLNIVTGEETLYMRLNILNMFVNRKLSLAENKQTSSLMKIARCLKS